MSRAVVRSHVHVATLLFGVLICFSTLDSDIMKKKSSLYADAWREVTQHNTAGAVLRGVLQLTTTTMMKQHATRVKL